MPLRPSSGKNPVWRSLNKQSVLFACILALSFFASSCTVYEKLTGKGRDQEESTQEQKDTLDYQALEKPIGIKSYQLAAPITWKQEHMKVRMSFDIAAQKAVGQSILTLSPHHKTKKIKVNAIGFYLQKDIELRSKDSSIKIERSRYDSLAFTITLNKLCTPTDTIQLVFNYEVLPTELLRRGLIKTYDQQGLFFINPDGSENNVPTQIWSQGETQYNSAWIPCLDYPNQKTSQEFYLTLDTPYVGLSNGRLVYMLLNDDGTRTFYWKQEKKHAPYLAMVAIGNFGIIEDETSKGLPVYYYLEQEYVPYAQLIFGKTPKMIEFFSKRFGYEYPWDKYAQVAVRDFVAGAMENTSATTLTHRIQKDSIGHNDNNYEDYIAHELGHQWFGDLVTSESWANLTLNEAFATYSEYLWIEESQGAEKADEALLEMMATYLREAKYTVHPLIHYAYHENDDMFDRHSYQKGALALHTLRLHLGDAFFFSGIKTYLHQNEFKAVDVDHLRHAFEDASGLDLRAFFDQWFLYANHPIVNIHWSYSDSTQLLSLNIAQEQAKNGYGVYDLVLPISIKTLNGKVTDTLKTDLSETSMDLKLPAKPEYCYVDYKAYPLVALNMEQAETDWLNMLGAKEQPLQIQAATNLLRKWEDLRDESKDKYLTWAYRQDRGNSLLDAMTLDALKSDSVDRDVKPFLKSEDYSILAKTLRHMAQREMGNKQLFEDFLKMPSHYVKAACIGGLCTYYDNSIENQFLKESHTRSTYLQYVIAECWSDKGSEAVNVRFQELVRSYNRTTSNYAGYIGRQSTSFVAAHISFLHQLYAEENISLNQLKASYAALLASSEQHQSVENHLHINTLIDKELSRLEP